MGKYYNGKLKSIEETKNLQFSQDSNYSCFHVRVSDIVLSPSPQLRQSPIVLQISTQKCRLVSPPCWTEMSPYRIHGNHVPSVSEILLVFYRILPLFKDSSLSV